MRIGEPLSPPIEVPAEDPAFWIPEPSWDIPDWPDPATLPGQPIPDDMPLEPAEPEPAEPIPADARLEGARGLRP